MTTPLPAGIYPPKMTDAELQAVVDEAKPNMHHPLSNPRYEYWAHRFDVCMLELRSRMEEAAS